MNCRANPVATWISPRLPHSEGLDSCREGERHRRLIALATDDIVVVHGNGKAAIGVDALRADLKHDFGIFDVKPRDASAKIIVHDKWAIEFCEVDQVVSGVKGGSGVQMHSRIVAAFSLNQEPEIVRRSHNFGALTRRLLRRVPSFLWSV